MTFEPRRGQEHVLEATDPVLVVLGGAGTGKTTVAAAAVRRILDRSIDHGTLRRRALFLSFSRAAVGQVVHRTSKTLGSQTDFVEITTFHAFAWKLIRRWGDAIGVAEPRLISPSEAKLFGSTVGTTFDELLPLALKLLEIPAIRKHFERRWAVIVSDEFQDTSRDQFELIMRIRGHARLLLLGDLNQCIYSNLPGAVGVGPTRIAAALALPGARAVHLPDVSHRDPTNILPAAAAAIRQRNFNHASVRAALDSGMLEVRHHHDPSAEGALIADLVTELQAAGHETVGIFSHHVDSTASLSDSLNGAGIAHEIVGLPDSVTSALQTQFEMLSYSAGEGSASMVRRALAVFVTSTERGGRAPELARMIAGYITAPTTLQARLARLNSNLVVNACARLHDSSKAPARIQVRLGRPNVCHRRSRTARFGCILLSMKGDTDRYDGSASKLAVVVWLNDSVARDVRSGRAEWADRAGGPWVMSAEKAKLSEILLGVHDDVVVGAWTIDADRIEPWTAPTGRTLTRCTFHLQQQPDTDALVGQPSPLRGRRNPVALMQLRDVIGYRPDDAQAEQPEFGQSSIGGYTFTVHRDGTAEILIPSSGSVTTRYRSE